MGLGNHYNDEKFAPVGPCITTIMDIRNQPVLEDGITFEEGSIPAPIVSFMSLSMPSLAGAIGQNTNGSFTDWLRDFAEEGKSLISGPYHGATNRTQTYLVMTHDDGSGVMSLENGKLSISWPGVGKEAIFKKVEQVMIDATKALGGTFIRDLVWSKLFNYGLVTVHPLGGCNMADDASSGVTNDVGNVFSGDQGTTTFPGLYVLDGAIIPLPLGTNPLFTISALAERASKLIIENMNLKATYDFPEVHPTFTIPAPAVQFTETMKGYFSKGVTDDYEKGYQLGEQKASPMLFTLTIQTIEMDKFMTDPEHMGHMGGTLIAPALSEKPLTISDGIFNLFVKDAENPNHLKMKYSMQLNTFDGKQYYFSAYKKVDGAAWYDLWNETTVLYVTVSSDNSLQNVLGKGILKIAPMDLATQLRTIKAVNTTNIQDSLKALKSFSTFFGEEIINTYFKHIFTK
jgi:cholesterol oxidase